jgi:putative spermidine/putrescine transport system substrate-binding protein
MRCRTVARSIALFGAVGLAVAGCGGSNDTAPTLDNSPPAASAYAGPVGPGEGKLSVLAWPGYAEDGSTDPTVDWVTPFEQATGCQVTVKTFATSAEAVQLFSTGEYDVVSASGDASLRLVYGDRVQPVNTDLVPNYTDVLQDLKNKPWNTVSGINYGVPHGRGANLLLYNKATYPTPPTSWADMWEPGSPAAGKISPYADAIYIADAALYLMAHRPELGITYPYALDQTQFDAAIDLLKQQKPMVAEYWADVVKQGQGLATGTLTESQGWQLTANLVNANGESVGTTKPVEGATGWSDTWMVKKDTPNINCAYLWLNHIVSPEANAQVAEFFGEAPANTKSCALTKNPDHCTQYHAEETDFWNNVYYWTTPVEQCLDGRTDVECIGYDEWVRAWTEMLNS